MEATLFLRNKLKRHITWNGQELTFKRYVKNQYEELTDEVEQEFNLIGLFHDGGGYGGMLNVELFERDGGRTTTKFKPMILALYEDANVLDVDDRVTISNETYKVVEVTNVKQLNIAVEISLEVDNGRS